MPLTRQEKINKLVNHVGDWELDSLIEYSKEKVRENLNSLPDDIIDSEYEDVIVIRYCYLGDSAGTSGENKILDTLGRNALSDG